MVRVPKGKYCFKGVLTVLLDAPVDSSLMFDRSDVVREHYGCVGVLSPNSTLNKRRNGVLCKILLKKWFKKTHLLSENGYVISTHLR